MSLPSRSLFFKYLITNLPSKFANPICIAREEASGYRAQPQFGVFFYCYSESAKHPDSHDWKEMWIIPSCLLSIYA